MSEDIAGTSDMWSDKGDAEGVGGGCTMRRYVVACLAVRCDVIFWAMRYDILGTQRRCRVSFGNVKCGYTASSECALRCDMIARAVFFANGVVFFYAED